MVRRSDKAVSVRAGAAHFTRPTSRGRRSLRSTGGFMDLMDEVDRLDAEPRSAALAAEGWRGHRGRRQRQRHANRSDATTPEPETAGFVPSLMKTHLAHRAHRAHRFRLGPPRSAALAAEGWRGHRGRRQRQRHANRSDATTPEPETAGFVPSLMKTHLGHRAHRAHRAHRFSLGPPRSAALAAEDRRPRLGTSAPPAKVQPPLAAETQSQYPSRLLQVLP